MGVEIKRTAFVYIDGFNFYYGALKNRGMGLKWLDIASLLTKLLPDNSIKKIKYFTAGVSGKLDPGKPLRQELYFRALRTIPEVEIIKGSFTFNRKRIRITADVDMLAVLPEEKCTDVNLSVHLLNDALNERPDASVIISNDSDLSEALKLTSRHVSIGILNPYERFNGQLDRYAIFNKHIREGVIRSSQFPEIMKDSIGTFKKPNGW